MNNNLSVTMTTVNIGDKVLTIMSDTVEPVMEAGAALEKYFMPEESEIKEPEAGAVEAVLPALPSEDAMAGEMETESSGQATEMPAPDCSEGGDYENTAAEVLETVTGALDLPRTPGWRRAVCLKTHQYGKQLNWQCLSWRLLLRLGKFLKTLL